MTIAGRRITGYTTWVGRRLRRTIARTRGLAGEPDPGGGASSTGRRPADALPFVDTDPTLLQSYRQRAALVLEVGSDRPRPVRVWQQHLDHPQPVGLDVAAGRLWWGTTSSARRRRRSDRRRRDSGTSVLAWAASRLAPTIVLDDGSALEDDRLDALRTLLPVLVPGGVYLLQLPGASETAVDGDGALLGYLRTIAAAVGGAASTSPSDEFVAYAAEVLTAAEFVPSGVILRKRAFPQARYDVRSVLDLALEPHVQEVGGSYQRIEAALVDAGRPIRDAFDRLYGDGLVVVPPAASGELRLPRVSGSGLVTVGGAVIDETLNCARNLRRGSGLYQVVREAIWVDEGPMNVASVITAVEGHPHVLLKQTWDANYGHWLIDTLPKVGLLREFEDLSRCIYVLNTQAPAMRSVVEQSLAMVGIGPEQLLYLDRKTYAFERLIVLGTLSRHPFTKSPFAMEVLAGAAADAGPSAFGERLYVTRRAARRRRVLNEDAVIEVLSAHGYRSVAPEELPVREQAATFRDAPFVVGVMGAALANLAFAPRGVAVLSLATPAMEHDYFYDIVCLKGGRYRGLQGSTDDPSPSLSSDFVVDLDRLQEGLDWLHGGERR